jgi:hypothetical protein
VISHRSRLAPWRAATLVALLLLAQALGFAHAVAHGLAPAAPPALQHSADDDEGHQAGSAECRLVDAHGWLDLATGGAPATDRRLPTQAHGTLPLALHPSVAPHWAPPARGPPR